MQTYIWNESFITGVDSIDEQHKRLVELINQLAVIQSATTPDPQAIEAVFRELVDYAHVHFRDEEQLMRSAGIEATNFQHHVKVHRDFITQVKVIWQARGLMSSPAETLHGFLSAWLSYHILGEDQAMVRTMRSLKGEQEPALFSEPIYNEFRTNALLQTLRNLHGVLSHLNHDLLRANKSLEKQVAERTRELTEANTRLEADRSELEMLLHKVDETQSQLLQSEKMASIGQLAAGVAHEINNPIGFVNSNLGTLGRYVEDILRLAEVGAATDEGGKIVQEIDFDYLRNDLRDLLRESQDGVQRVRKIVADLKDFSRVDQAEWQMADLIEGLESTINVAWHEIKYKAEIVRDLAPLPLVRCVPAQINQVLMNLLVNAAQAIPERGIITLRSGAEDVWAWIEVEDSGSGMNEETRRRMFDPFFTTKPVGKGTGLGMSIAWDILNKHGGSIDVDSAVGKGTRIRLWLPIAGPAEQAAGTSTGGAVVQAG
jgi:hemerythrin-like metal-binding protein